MKNSLSSRVSSKAQYQTVNEEEGNEKEVRRKDKKKGEKKRRITGRKEEG